MKVNGNDRMFSLCGHGNVRSNIPIRLEIASRVLPSITEIPADQAIKLALKIADALIAEHNKSCEEKE